MEKIFKKDALIFAKLYKISKQTIGLLKVKIFPIQKLSLCYMACYVLCF